MHLVGVCVKCLNRKTEHGCRDVSVGIRVEGTNAQGKFL